jgi:amylosucrase
LGDEVGTLNDYGYRLDPAKASDSRWVHRPAANWGRIAQRQDGTTLEGRVYLRLQQLICIRKKHAAFSGNDLHIVDTASDHVLGYLRQHQGSQVLVLANFCERPQTIPGEVLRAYGAGYVFTDLITGKGVSARELVLEPYGMACRERN